MPQKLPTMPNMSSLRFIPPPKKIHSVSVSSELTDSQLGRNSVHNLNMSNINEMMSHYSELSSSPTRSHTRTFSNLLSNQSTGSGTDDESSQSSRTVDQQSVSPPIDLSTILRWMDGELNEYRPDNTFEENDVEEEGVDVIGLDLVLSSSEPPSDELIIYSLLSLIYRDPQFDFVKQTAIALKDGSGSVIGDENANGNGIDIDGTGFTFSTCCKKIEQSFYLLSNNQRHLSQKKLEDLLYLLKDDINKKSDRTTEVHYNDISRDIEKTFEIKLGTNGERTLQYFEFFSWYRTVEFVERGRKGVDVGDCRYNSDGDKLIHSNSAFGAIVEYLRHKSIDSHLRLKTLEKLHNSLNVFEVSEPRGREAARPVRTAVWCV